MTTMAALMGTLPIAMSRGAGAESRRPLGIAVVGGLAFSQLITLFITPVVYTYLDAVSHRSGHWLSRFGRKKPVEAAPVPVPTTAVAIDTRVVASSSGDAAD